MEARNMELCAAILIWVMIFYAFRQRPGCYIKKEGDIILKYYYYNENTDPMSTKRPKWVRVDRSSESWRIGERVPNQNENPRYQFSQSGFKG